MTTRDPPCELCGKDLSDCHCYDCPTCKGKGTVNPLTAPAGFFCAGTTDCPHCDGTGEKP
jgi:DnaJ-class molecular chaperone